MLRFAGRACAATGVAAAGGALAVREAVGHENFDRAMRFYALAVPGYVEYKICDVRTKGLPQGERDEAFEALHGRYAPRALDIILELGGFYTKTGQMAASNIGNAFPDTWVQTMEVLQDNVPAKGFETVRAIVEDEYGKPLGEVFEDFEEAPIGAASIGQVHRATLRDGGRQVVVKVQYPDVERLFRGDVWTIKYFCKAVQPEHVPALEEIEKQFMTEFDYAAEAAQLDQVRRNLQRPFPDIVVPEPYHEKCTSKVLVMEDLHPATKLADALRKDMEKFAALEGISPEELREREERLDRQAAAEGRLRSGPSAEEMDRVIRAVKAKVFAANLAARLHNYTVGWLPFVGLRDVVDPKDVVPLNHARLVDDLLEVHGHEILIDGVFNGDPHPGNVLLVHRAGAADRLGLIDYGQVKRLPDAVRILFAKLLVALANEDRDRVVALMAESGYRTKHMDAGVHYALAKLFFDADGPDVTGNVHVQAFLDELQARDPVVELATDFVMIGRVAIMLRGLGHVLNQHRSTAHAWLPLAKRVLQEAGEWEGAGNKMPTEREVARRNSMLHSGNPVAAGGG